MRRSEVREMELRGGICIVEGTHEPGRTRLVKCLYDATYPARRDVHLFGEEAVLACPWHNQMPGIHGLRLELMASLLSYAEAVLVANPSALFIVDRLHASYAMWRQVNGQDRAELAQSHRRLVSRLRRLPVLLLHCVCDEKEDARRGAADGGAEVVAARRHEQQRITAILEADELPFHRVRSTLDRDPLADILQ